MKTGDILKIVGAVIVALMVFTLFTKHPIYGFALVTGATLYFVGTKLDI